MVDAYIWGRVSRISPEAPIPVVEVMKEESRPGGAANVGLNMMALGAKVDFLGVIGNDSAGEQMRRDLQMRGAGVTGIINSDCRPTTIKTRVIAQHQQMLRIDKESVLPLAEERSTALLAAADPLVAAVDGIVFSDYNKGVLQKALVEALTQAAQGKIITVDPKPQNMSLFRDATLVTPNKKEAEGAVGFPLRSEEAVRLAGEKLRAELNLKATLITRGEEGMSLFDGVSHTTIPTQAKQVYDVTGAGDTVISVATLALCAGASFKEASILANLAAGITVGHVGVHAVTASELIAAIE